MTSLPVRGRFAPSPTGLLHFGSLVTAVGSFLTARSYGGQWFVRIEDVDTPRVVPGAADAILRTLERFGLTWDGEVVYQSQRIAHYEAALAHLIANNVAYPCTCSRRAIAQHGQQSSQGLIYPGTCRARPWPSQPAAIRLLTDRRIITFTDLIQGPQQQCLETEVGDFVIRRADGLFAYQLAVVVDDAAAGITHIVRGCDLLDSTPRQRYLQTLLNLPTPNYAHLPLVVDSQGHKLSKQTFAAPINTRFPHRTLAEVLRFLDHPPPRDLAGASLATLWDWARSHWQLDRIAAVHHKVWPEATKRRLEAS